MRPPETVDRLAHWQTAEATSSLFEASRLPMWIYDLQTLAFLAVNDAALGLYGYSREELLAVTVRQLHLPADADEFRELTRLPSVPDHKETWRHAKKMERRSWSSS